MLVSSSTRWVVILRTLMDVNIDRHHLFLESFITDIKYSWKMTQGTISICNESVTNTCSIKIKYIYKMMSWLELKKKRLDTTTSEHMPALLVEKMSIKHPCHGGDWRPCVPVFGLTNFCHFLKGRPTRTMNIHSGHIGHALFDTGVTGPYRLSKTPFLHLF